MKWWHSIVVGMLALAPAACDRGESEKVASNQKAGARAQGFGELTVDQVAERIGKPGVYIYDNNNRDEWVAGHVPTATWVDYEKMTTADLPADKNATLIFYCHNEH
jgi:hypothetical protein